MIKRRYCIMFVFTLLCLTNVFAQTLKVESFTMKPNDLAARTQTRQDINGVDCALVKVQLAASGATFNGNVVGDVKYNTSEYWVYMAQGSKRLSIRLEGYLPLEVTFEDYEVRSLESKTVYVMVISGITTSQTIDAPRIRTGWIIINSKPTSASVYVNDEFVGNTPLTNYKQVYGTYTYRVEKPNYHPSKGTIELNSGRLEKKVELKPAFGSIAIASNVAGATVLLDGNATNKVTPCTLEMVPSGQHTITIQMEKYAPRQQSVTVEDGQTAQLSASLDARFAKVSISSLDGAKIFCNGELKGTTQYAEDMMEGYYDIEVRLAHHKPATKQIHVLAGQSQELTLSPTPIYGTLDVTSSPYDANVTIDGKQYGKTPLTVDEILEGEHTITLKKGGYNDMTQKVTVKENETAEVSLTMNNIPVVTDEKTFTVTGNGKTVTFKMKLVEAGTFQMGSEKGFSDETPIHSVTLTNSYYIGETEVTQALWFAVMGQTIQQLRDKAGVPWPLRGEGDNYPAYYISYEDCQQFITKLNKLTGMQFRFPTEAEWEFAARGGNMSNGYTYAGSNTVGDIAWYDDNSGDATHAVKTKYSNELGLYDMSGNIWEWCYDWYGSYSSAAQTDPTGAILGSDRVSRGGSWGSYARNCRIANRLSYSSTRTDFRLGFRLAL